MAIAGRKAQVRVSGVPVPFTNAATTPDATLKEYRITDTTKALLDPSSTVTVRRSPDGTTFTAVPATQYTINRFSGTVIFATAQTAGTQVQVSGSSVTTSVAAEAKEYSYTLKSNTTEASRFGDTHVRRMATLHDVSGSISAWTTADRYFENALTAGKPVLLEFYSDSTVPKLDLRTWAILSKSEIKAAIDGLQDTSVEWEGTADADGRMVSLA